MKINLTVDRFEGEQAVLLLPNLSGQTDTIINWPKNLLPPEAREGASLVFAINSEAEAVEY